MSLLCAALVQVCPKPCTGGLGTTVPSSQLQKHESVLWERHGHAINSRDKEHWQMVQGVVVRPLSPDWRTLASNMYYWSWSSQGTRKKHTLPNAEGKSAC